MSHGTPNPIPGRCPRTPENGERAARAEGGVAVEPEDRLSRSETSRAPSRAEWDRLIAGDGSDGYQVVPGRRAHREPPKSMDETRRLVESLSFHSIDPFVATVAAAVGAGMTKIPRGEEKVSVDIPDFYGKPVEAKVWSKNGPEAPMMLILPGIHGSGSGSHTDTFKKMAIERGMNYTVLPNSLSEEALDWEPRYHPGNPAADAEATHALLAELQRGRPELFGQVSVAGYSYGALHGANLVRLDEGLQEGERLVTGALIGVSPPENLERSMGRLDGLREQYSQGAGNIIGTGLNYRIQVGRHGYENFMNSSLSRRGEGEQITEIKIADKYGSRDGMEFMVDRVDRQFGHERLPKNTQEYRDGSSRERRRLRQEHGRQIEEMTYVRFTDEWMVHDAWLNERGLTPQEMAHEYRFTEAIDRIENTPVMVFGSADDYILTDEDVREIRAAEERLDPREVLKTFDRGGHVGLLWNPEVQNILADFAFRPPAA